MSCLLTSVCDTPLETPHIHCHVLECLLFSKFMSPHSYVLALSSLEILQHFTVWSGDDLALENITPVEHCVELEVCVKSLLGLENVLLRV